MKINWKAAVMALEILVIVILVVSFVFALAWGFVDMWKSGCYWGIGIEVGLVLLFMFLYAYFGLKDHERED